VTILDFLAVLHEIDGFIDLILWVLMMLIKSSLLQRFYHF